MLKHTSQYIEKVRNYYDSINSLILNHIGTTYQAGIYRFSEKNIDPYLSHNLYLAKRAGIEPYSYVLDAGCGICGPSIAIAKKFSNVRLEAINISSNQVFTARKLVKENGLDDRLKVHVCDFHQLEYPEDTFDLVIFFECVGYSYDYYKLFSGIRRVLRPGGALYIKDIFIKEAKMTDKEKKELKEFNRIYAYNTPRMSDLTNIIRDVGFDKISFFDFSELMNTNLFVNSMFDSYAGFNILNEFGKYHHNNYEFLSTYFGEIKAIKPY